MRSITLICALLLLASCGHKNAKPKGPGSSPIIIADGSIMVYHSDLLSLSPTSFVLELPNHRPGLLGYGCDPSIYATINSCSGASPCTQAANGINASKCQVPLDPSVLGTWTLSVCDSGSTCASTSPVALTWTTDYKDRVNINSTIAPTVVTAGASGPGLKYFTDHLACARLLVESGATSTTYDFEFSSGTPHDVRVSYDCRSTGSSPCD